MKGRKHQHTYRYEKQKKETVLMEKLWPRVRAKSEKLLSGKCEKKKKHRKEEEKQKY